MLCRILMILQKSEMFECFAKFLKLFIKIDAKNDEFCSDILQNVQHEISKMFEAFLLKY